MSETQEKNKALVRRLYELDARGDIEAMEKLLAPDFVDHSLLPDQDPGREGYLKSVAEEHAIFSNIRHIIEDQVAEGDKVTSRLSVSRIHDRGEHLGVAPTGMEFKTTGILIHRIVRGKVTDEWSESRGVLEATRQRLEQERIVGVPSSLLLLLLLLLTPKGLLGYTQGTGEGADRALPHRWASPMDHILDRAHRYPSSGALTEVRGVIPF